LIEEGKRRTQQVIDNDPVLSFVLRLRDQSEPRGLPALTAHIPSLASEPTHKVRSTCGRIAQHWEVEVGLPATFQGRISSASQ
jgi:hypothetical protein